MNWRRVKKLFLERGFPFRVVPADCFCPCWDGQMAAIREPNKDRDHLSNAIHEFAHWLVCPEERRGEIDFGLGDCPDSPAFFATSQLENPWPEECLASWLGIQIEKALGMDWEETYKLHSWDQCAWMEADEAYAKLEEMGLLEAGEFKL